MSYGLWEWRKKFKEERALEQQGWHKRGNTLYLGVPAFAPSLPIREPSPVPAVVEDMDYYTLLEAMRASQWLAAQPAPDVRQWAYISPEEKTRCEQALADHIRYLNEIGTISDMIEQQCGQGQDSEVCNAFFLLEALLHQADLLYAVGMTPQEELLFWRASVGVSHSDTSPLLVCIDNLRAAQYQAAHPPQQEPGVEEFIDQAEVETEHVETIDEALDELEEPSEWSLEGILSDPDKLLSILLAGGVSYGVYYWWKS